VGQAQHRFLAERRTQQLQADGQLRILREAARQADAAQSRQVHVIVKTSVRYI
jgi:hypothetical protein